MVNRRSKFIGNKSFDFVFANINLNILLNDMSAYTNVMHSGSKIILSGFALSIPLIDKKRWNVFIGKTINGQPSLSDEIIDLFLSLTSFFNCPLNY